MFTVENTISAMGVIQLLHELTTDEDKFDTIVREHYESCDINEVRLVISTMMSLLYSWKGEYEGTQSRQPDEEQQTD